MNVKVNVFAVAIFKIYSRSDISNNGNVSFRDIAKLKFIREGFYCLNFIPFVAFGRFMYKGYVLLSFFVLLTCIIAKMYDVLHLCSVFLFLFSSELELLFAKLKGYSLIDIVIAKNEYEARAIVCGKISKNCVILSDSKDEDSGDGFSCGMNKKSCCFVRVFKYFTHKIGKGV